MKTLKSPDPGRLKELLRNSHYKCVLDLNRATRNNDYLDELLTDFCERVAEVQVNGFVDGFYRVPFIVSKQEHLLERVKKVQAPFIIEGLFQPHDYLSIVKERELLKKNLLLN